MLPIFASGVLLAVVLFAYIILIVILRKYYKELQRQAPFESRLPIILFAIMILFFIVYTGFASYCGMEIGKALMNYLNGG